MDASASFLAMLDRIYVTALAGDQALSETRRRDALDRGLARVRLVLLDRLGDGDATYLQDVLDAHPELEDRVRRLREELGALVRRLDRVLGNISSDPGLETIAPEALGLVIAIRAHELDEQALMD